MIILTCECAAFPRHDPFTKRSCLRLVSLATSGSRGGCSLSLTTLTASRSFSASQNRRSIWPTSAPLHSGRTASARSISWLRLLFVRERGTSKDQLMKFPNPEKLVTTPSFSRILVEIALRFVTEQKPRAKNRIGGDSEER